MKKKIKNALFNFFCVTVPVTIGFVLILELIVFRYILPASDFPLRRFDKKNAMMTYTPREKGTIRIFPNLAARFNINNYGWNATMDFSPEKKLGVTRIAVIGDSFIDALMVDTDKTMAEVMERDLMQRGRSVETYNLGTSGAPLSQYLHVMRYADKHFQPDVVVINIVHNDFVDSLTRFQQVPQMFTYAREKNGAFKDVAPAPYAPNKYKRLLFRSRTVRFLYFNCKLKDRRFFSNFLNKPDPGRFQANIDTTILNDWDAIEALTDHIFVELKREAGKRHVRLILTMDTPRQFIYRGQDPRECVAYKLNTLAERLARRHGIPFLDLTDAFISDFAKRHKRFEYKWDGHWSAYGHKIAGSAAADYLLKNNLIPARGNAPANPASPMLTH